MCLPGLSFFSARDVQQVRCGTAFAASAFAASPVLLLGPCGCAPYTGGGMVSVASARRLPMCVSVHTDLCVCRGLACVCAASLSSLCSTFRMYAAEPLSPPRLSLRPCLVAACNTRLEGLSTLRLHGACWCVCRCTLTCACVAAWHVSSGALSSLRSTFSAYAAASSRRLACPFARGLWLREARSLRGVLAHALFPKYLCACRGWFLSY